MVPLKKLPSLIFDHRDMVALAQQKLRYKAAFHPIVFEMLPRSSRSHSSSTSTKAFSILLWTNGTSPARCCLPACSSNKRQRKGHLEAGAFYYKLDKRKYQTKFNAFLNFIPNPDSIR